MLRRHNRSRPPKPAPATCLSNLLALIVIIDHVLYILLFHCLSHPNMSFLISIPFVFDIILILLSFLFSLPSLSFHPSFNCSSLISFQFSLSSMSFLTFLFFSFIYIIIIFLYLKVLYIYLSL